MAGQGRRQGQGRVVRQRRGARGDHLHNHDIFISGNDAGAKAQVADVLKSWFGWKNVIDLGDISTARGTEMYLLLWVRLWGALQTPVFNIKIVR